MATGLIGSAIDIPKPIGIGSNINPMVPPTAASPQSTVPNYVTQVAAPTPVAPRPISTNETVAGQLNSLLKGNSTYMQSAANRGMEQANQRGLINSSLAAGTSTRAAIDAALPIATSDATTYANAGLSAQEANQQQALTGYNAGLTEAQSRENYGLNAVQQKENFGYTTAENEQQNRAAMERQIAAQGSQADLQSQSLAAQQARQAESEQAAANLQTTLKQMDINLDTSKLASSDRQALTSAVSPIIQQVESEIAQIQRMPDEQMNTDAKAAAIADLNANLKSRLATISSLYGFDIGWETPATPSAQPAANTVPQAPPNQGYPSSTPDAGQGYIPGQPGDPNYISA